MHPLVVGLAARAGWEYVRGWVMSLRGSGYSGEAVLVTAECEDGIRDECARWDVQTVEIDPSELATRHIIDPTNGRHGALARVIEGRYADRFVLASDTRDVVFQADPFDFFKASRKADVDKLHVVSEEAVFDQDESQAGRWGAEKLEQLFSSRERSELRGRESYNIGILCGPALLVAGMQRLVHLMCFNSPARITDQAAMNLIMRTEPWRTQTVRLGIADGWAVHFALVKFRVVRAEIAPTIQDGVVTTVEGRPISIVHQYNRDRSLRELVEERLQEIESGEAAAETT